MADKRAHDAEAQRPFLAGESSEDVLQKMKVDDDEPKPRTWTAWVRILAEVLMAGAIVVLLLQAWQRGKGGGEEKPLPVPTCRWSYYFSGYESFGGNVSRLTRRRAEEDGDVST